MRFGAQCVNTAFPRHQTVGRQNRRRLSEHASPVLRWEYSLLEHQNLLMYLIREAVSGSGGVPCRGKGQPQGLAICRRVSFYIT
jgi:hypothetical protein